MIERSWAFRAAALLMMLAAPRVAAGQRTIPTADERAVTRTVEALFAAAERGDNAALDTLYAANVTIVEGAGINRSWAEYRDSHLAAEMKEMKNFRYRPAEIEPRVRGNTAWAIFRYTLQAEAQGKPVDIVGRGTAVLERKDHRWVIVHTQTSGRPRRPTDPPAP